MIRVTDGVFDVDASAKYNITIGEKSSAASVGREGLVHMFMIDGDLEITIRRAL